MRSRASPTSSSMSTTVVAEQRGHAQALRASARALADSDGGKAAQHPLAGFDQQDPSLAWSRCDRKSRAQSVARDLGDLARHLHAGRTAADDHEGQPGRASLGIGLELGGLERAQDPARISSALSSDLSSAATSLPVVVTEIRCNASRRRRSACRRPIEPAPCSPRDRSQRRAGRASRSNVGDLGEQRRARCGCGVKMRAQRIGRSPPGESAPVADLVGQRLEEVEVPPVDERDLDRRRASFSAACRPPKPPPTTTTRWRSTAFPARDSARRVRRGNRAAHARALTAKMPVAHAKATAYPCTAACPTGSGAPCAPAR